ncbi:MAG: exodeoxyribonuclease VII large subunit [Deltaproteobacteria bacterium]|nr:exodeoxyribonuclease VII large subunit [Deltaproteobacteria bacterium]
MDTPYRPVQRRILTISEFSGLVKKTLEDAYPYVWVTGEISNFSAPSSGHFYFSLKDLGAQVKCVMWKGINRHLKFSPADGMAAIALGRVSVYEPQGAYQLIIEHLEPAGIGALAVAFMQMKEKLEKEGLFDQKRKRPLPFLPGFVSVITSPTGAVIHDILRVAGKRYENARIQVVPVKVQGETSAAEIVAALETVNRRAEADVIILARGGGSLEDLAPFNTEAVARAVHSSAIPVVSAVGHETDTTICDFVADQRAPTPTAAAQMVWPEKEAWVQRIDENAMRLTNLMKRLLERKSLVLEHNTRRLIPPNEMAARSKARLESLMYKLESSILRNIENRARLSLGLKDRLMDSGPQSRAQKLKSTLELFDLKLRHSLAGAITGREASLNGATGRLKALSPRAVLERGYSITLSVPRKAVIRRSDMVHEGQPVEITLGSGSLICRVEKTAGPKPGKETESP